MSKMKGGKGPRRSGGTDRGGIRKRGGPTRVDRDGDMEMDAAGGGARGRGKRTRGDSGRPSGPRAPAVDAIQKAISGSTTTPQVNIRQGGKGSNLEQVSIRGWKQSKAASNRDGGHESLVTFLEKKINATDSKAGSRARISKVCATSQPLAVTDMNSRLRPLRCVLVFRDGLTPKRRSTLPGLSRVCSFG